MSVSGSSFAREIWKSLGIVTSGNKVRVENFASGSPANAAVDAFGNTRVTTPFTVHAIKQLADKRPLFYDDQEVTSATDDTPIAETNTSSTFNANRASTVIAVDALQTAKRVRQSFNWFDYQSGKSQRIFITLAGRSTPSGITKRVGMFNLTNGIYLKITSESVYWGIRSFVTGAAVDTEIAQADWNIQKLDGTDSTAPTLDITQTQIITFDFEWLGVGSVRVGFVINKVIYYVHQFDNANLNGSVYMSTPNLPVRYEIENDGSGDAASLETICAAVSSEGGVQPIGTTRHLDRKLVGNALAVSSTHAIIPVMSFRLKSAYFGTTVKPISTSVFVEGSEDFAWRLMIDPDVASDNVNWQDLANSAIQYDITRGTNQVLTNGTVIAGDIVRGSNQGVPVPNVLETRLNIGSYIGGTPQELVLGYQRLASGNSTVWGGLSWAEID